MEDAPDVVLGAGLVLRGAGMGATLMPAMAAAYQALPQAAVARAASLLEIVQRVGASLGIALLAVVLQHGLHGLTLSALEDMPAAARPDLGAPFATAFAWAVALDGDHDRPGAAAPAPRAGPGSRAGLSRAVKRGKPTRGWTLGHQKIRRLTLARGRS